MARFYGGDARESPIPEFGAMEIQLHDGEANLRPFVGNPDRMGIS